MNCCLCLGCLPICFTPVTREIASAFNTSIYNVNLTFMLGCITGIPMTFVCIYLYRTFPSHWVLRGACCIALLGGWFRLFSKSDGQYWPILIGSNVVLLSNPMFFMQMTKFCNQWFSDDERTLATVICALTLPAGNIVAFMLGIIIF